MAKNSITDYSKTAASNTDIQSVDIAEGCLPSGINNAIREIMADLADMNDGTVALTSPSFAAATITGDLTVDTNTLHVDSTNNNVGIGESNPATRLEIKDATPILRLTDSLNSAQVAGHDIARISFFSDDGSGIGPHETGFILNESEEGGTSLSGALVFGTAEYNTAATERMRINSSGDVGIGTSSPSSKLHVDGHIKYNGRLLPASTAADGTAGAPAIPVGYDYNTGFFRPTADTIGFSTNATERMRIDSSGNVLVGKTSDAFGTAGVEIRSEGRTRTTRDGGSVALFNRLNSDGNILEFYKDSTAVGLIGSASGVVSYHVLDTRSGGVGIMGTNLNNIIPTNGTGTPADNAKDLGLGSQRWRNLYLGGGVYLGGTGDANKLDDYEEGTFTPIFSRGATAMSPTPSYSIQNGKYTKIGDMVHAEIYLRFNNNFSGGSGAYVIQGLPFSNNSMLQGISWGLMTVFSSDYNLGAHYAYLGGTAVNLSPALGLKSSTAGEYLTFTIQYKAS